MSLIHVIILAIVEGLTEFLPISSTGHMIIAESVMGDKGDFVKLFTVAVQLGAILSVVVLYWKRFIKSINFYVKLIIAFIPAAVFGLLFAKKIDALLESALTVGITLFIGGIILLFVDDWFNKPVVTKEEDINNATAFKIGLFQCLAMILPGTSRSAASIVGGMSQKLSRTAAAEFSFFLAVPTMFAATAKKLWDFHKEGHVFSGEEIKMLAIGNVIAFIVALLAIRTFITFLEKRGFKLFGVYRILIGGLIIGIYLTGHTLELV